jgi:hypothetical protein
MKSMREKLLWAVVVVLGVVAPFGHAQQANMENLKTKGLINGRFWTLWKHALDVAPPEKKQAASERDDNWKTAFLFGYCEAAVTLPCPPQLQFDEIIKGIDKFYQEPENLRFPFVLALRVLVLKVTGAKATEIDAAMAAARDWVDKPEQAPK